MSLLNKLFISSRSKSVDVYDIENYDIISFDIVSSPAINFNDLNEKHESIQRELRRQIIKDERKQKINRLNNL